MVIIAIMCLDFDCIGELRRKGRGTDSGVS